MKFELSVAWRYLRARRKHVVLSFITLISVLGIMTGVAALIIVLSLYSGLIDDIQQKILGSTAHVTVLARSGGLVDYEATAERISALPGVRQVSPAIFVQAMINAGPASSGVVLKGVDPAAAARNMAGHAVLQAGQWADLATGRHVILGTGLARLLAVREGAFVNLIIPQGTLSPLGMMPRIQRFRVTGIVETGLYDLDNSWAYISLQNAQPLARLDKGNVQCLEVRTTDIYDVERAQARISRALGDEYELSHWIEKNKAFFAALTMEKWSMFLAIALIIIVAALNIISTLVMMVMEKNRDIAIFRAMGATSRQIMHIFMAQGVIIGVIGALLGSALGVTLAWAADHFRWISMDAEVYLISYLPFRIGGLEVFLVAAAAVVVSFAATLYPSRQAAGIDPVEVIRYE
ncbi:MAG: lipoprotein-releasing ABC transporter permease subunit [Acidobacteria bacterium]|nr:lipoprotein-releasing ABC transporter permease subunit [Acidobacteriota bacterium]